MFWTIVAGLILLATAPLPAAKAQQLLPLPSSGYAERLYNNYSAATTGAISFSVQTVQNGPMTALAGVTLGSLVTLPPYRIEADLSAPGLGNPRFIVPDDPTFGSTDLSYTADGFATNGFPLEDGAYRTLSVTATINGDTRSHDAVEFCWPSLNHCAVLDPVVVFLQSKLDTLSGLAAAGWTPKSMGTLSAAADVAAAGRCGLASHPNWIGETITWPAYPVTAKDIFGITLFHMNIAEQQVGITCDSSCHPHPFANSNDSSSFGNLGYHTACGNRGDTGVSGSQARSIAETKCTESFLGRASASVSVNGKGASISFSWDLSGSAFSNGGVYSDACARF
jgi:hypothetical protein